MPAAGCCFKGGENRGCRACDNPDKGKVLFLSHTDSWTRGGERRRALEGNVVGMEGHVRESGVAIRPARQ